MTIAGATNPRTSTTRAMFESRVCLVSFSDERNEDTNTRKQSLVMSHSIPSVLASWWSSPEIISLLESFRDCIHHFWFTGVPLLEFELGLGKHFLQLLPKLYDSWDVIRTSQPIVHIKWNFVLLELREETVHLILLNFV